MASTTYTVKKGDTLWSLAQTYNTTVAKLVELNHIKNPNYIVVGQVLVVSGDAAKAATNNTSRAVINVFGLQSNTDRTVYATWTWSKSNTEHYQTIWYYDTGDGVWFIGNDSTTKDNQSVYNAPTNAERVKFKVKPISKTKTVNNKETSYWTAGWSTEKTYSFSNNPPQTPGAPDVNLDGYKLTAELNNIDLNATSIQFQIVKDNSTVFNTGTSTIKTAYASYSCTVTAGSEYKVRCRSCKGKDYSEWGPYSNSVDTIPAASSGITTIRATSETSVYLEWGAVSSAESYDLEFTTKTDYFDGSDQTTTQTGIEYPHFEKTGLESGQEYFFRVRAVNSEGESAWSEIASVVIGTDPAAPTTWSSTTTAITGEELFLYWVHNSEDGSSQTYAELEITTNGVLDTHTIQNTSEEDEKDKTSSFVIDTSGYAEGVKIQWRVRTAGITKTYGDWSVERTIDIYAPATLELKVTDVSGELLDTLTSFPVYIAALAGPNTQVPIGYQLSVSADEAYETVDQIGNVKMVNKDEKVYSKYFDTTDQLILELSANNIDLENNIHYTIVCSVTMNSGLTAEAMTGFNVSWTDNEYEPNAEVNIDRETLTAYIRPYCSNGNGEDIDDIMLSVYRREFDGGFVELATGLENGKNTFITDPHPALDYARYRIVAMTKSTGAVSYCDLAGIPVDEKSVVIQWGEEWSNYDTDNSDALEQPAWSGSFLKLPYNIDVSDSYSADTALVEYIGRKYPVSYYGTQRGMTSSWSVEIDKADKETLYALRRLALWMGDVYVREPSGSGYWAHVSVSFSQSHCVLTIPVTLDIARVEGGV